MKLAVLAAVFATASALLNAATLRVNNAPNTDPDHTTIQAAIDAAAAGDLILVEGSVTPYAGFSVSARRVTLIGPGYRLAENLGTPVDKESAVIVGSVNLGSSPSSPSPVTGSLLMGLEFRTYVHVRARGVTLARNYFVPSLSQLYVEAPDTAVLQSYFGSSLNLSTDVGGSRVENCIWDNSGGSLFFNPTLGAVCSFRHNVFRFAGIPGQGGPASAFENNIFLASISSNPAGTFRNNLFASPSPGTLVGTGNQFNVSPAAIMPGYSGAPSTPGVSFDARYQIAPAGPAANAATDGSHIGPFGGASPYVLSGVPPLPAITELSVPQFASPGADLRIKIKVTAQP